MPSKYYVLSVGGLGNQLFVWTFGQWLKQKFGRNVVFATDFVSQTSGKHKSFVTELEEIHKEITSDESVLRAFRARLGIRLAQLQAGGERSYARSGLMRLTKFNEVGFVEDYDFGLDRPGHQYLGYFQTSIFFDELGLSRRDFFGERCSAVARNEGDLAIHFRHGDYRFQNETFGILPEEYYSAAIGAQIEFKPVSNIRIFGLFDEFSIELISKLQSKFANIEFDLTNLLSPSDAYTDLMELSEYPRQIVSNSSFAWWAGALSQGGLKVAPEKWFKGMADPVNLIPKTWLQVSSSWM